jgi:hypothetical protein
LRTQLVALSLLLLVGCAKEPQAERESAQAALERARQAEAEIYAPAAYRAAVDTLGSADRELAAQQKRFAMARKFDRAKELYLESERLAQRAEEAAAEGMESARTEAESLQADLQAQTARMRELFESERGQSMLRSSRTGTAMEDLRTESGQVEAALSELELSLQRKAYRDALRIARSAHDQAESVLADLEQAIQTGVVPVRGAK